LVGRIEEQTTVFMLVKADLEAMADKEFRSRAGSPTIF
jgi:hypothetical protein